VKRGPWRESSTPCGRGPQSEFGSVPRASDQPSRDQNRSRGVHAEEWGVGEEREKKGGEGSQGMKPPPASWRARLPPAGYSPQCRRNLWPTSNTCGRMPQSELGSVLRASDEPGRDQNRGRGVYVNAWLVEEGRENGRGTTFVEAPSSVKNSGGWWGKKDQKLTRQLECGKLSTFAIGFGRSRRWGGQDVGST